MTAVIRVENAGSLQQVQIGPVDVVATLSAAHTAWGWVGGLRGISTIFRYCQREHDLEQIRNLFQHVEPEHGRCQILSQRGLTSVLFEDNPNVFQDTLGSKLVGGTICALSHIVEPKGAIRIFQDYFLDRLFKRSLADYTGAREAVCTYLGDNYQSIINEGIVHQLNDRFDEAISSMNLASRSQAPMNLKLGAQHQSDVTRNEVLFIKGFLRWFLQRKDMGTYYTRSATVARLASCLKCVGYQIREIDVWDGKGQRPVVQRGLVVVTGGSYETDPMLELESFVWSLDFVSHYHWNTMGAMLWNCATREVNETYHESFQQDFNNVHKLVTNSIVSIHWAVSPGNLDEVQAFPVWKDGISDASSAYAMRLASTLFPGCANRIAPFYESIAKERFMKIPNQYAQGKQNSREDISDPTKELLRFQAMTASICISILSRAAGDNFESLRHSTMLDLTQWTHLTRLCARVEAFIIGGCPMSQVIAAIATIHCATEIRQLSDKGDSSSHTMPIAPQPSGSTVVGWRNGRYAVLPALLYSMEQPLQQVLLGLQCADSFVANLPTQQDGAVRCPGGLSGPTRFPGDSTLEAIKGDLSADPEKAQIATEADNTVYLGAPHPTPADRPLHVSLERPARAVGEPFVSLCGRLGGESLGNVSIQDILVTLAMSWSDAEGRNYKFCAAGTPHKSAQNDDTGLVPAHRVFNMMASRYCSDLEVVPRDNYKSDPRYNVYVQIKGDTPWAIFLAGQNPFYNRLVFDCPQCAVYTGDNTSAQMRRGFTTLIGYS